MARERCSHDWPIPDPPGPIWVRAESPWCPWRRTYLQEHSLLPPPLETAYGTFLALSPTVLLVLFAII